jgi:hypothetical protein
MEKSYDRPPLTGTLLEELFAKADKTLQAGAEKLKQVQREERNECPNQSTR